MNAEYPSVSIVMPTSNRAAEDFNLNTISI